MNGHFTTPLFRGSTRMTVVRGPNGVALYSPVALDSADVDAIAALGPVTALIAPNLFHHRYLVAATELFPQARVYVPQGLEEKIGPVPRAEQVDRSQPAVLPEGIEAFLFDRHAVRELLLFHRTSATLVTSDMIYNYQREHGAGEKAMFGLMGCYGAPKVVFYHRFAIKDKAAVGELIEQVRAWQPRRIVMSHGRIVEDPAAGEIFADAWAKFA